MLVFVVVVVVDKTCFGTVVIDLVTITFIAKVIRNALVLLA